MDSRFTTSTGSSTQQSLFASSAASSKIAPPPRQAPKTSSADPFLKDFTLVAEAAKRAQMAVLMRDFESVGLS